jgi:hypothetical protein
MNRFAKFALATAEKVDSSKANNRQIFDVADDDWLDPRDPVKISEAEKSRNVQAAKVERKKFAKPVLKREELPVIVKGNPNNVLLV